MYFLSVYCIYSAYVAKEIDLLNLHFVKVIIIYTYCHAKNFLANEADLDQKQYHPSIMVAKIRECMVNAYSI